MHSKPNKEKFFPVFKIASVLTIAQNIHEAELSIKCSLDHRMIVILIKSLILIH